MQAKSFGTMVNFMCVSIIKKRTHRAYKVPCSAPNTKNYPGIQSPFFLLYVTSISKGDKKILDFACTQMSKKNKCRNHEICFELLFIVDSHP